MISARDFCRETGYPIAIVLTYSFHPIFFERVALRDLEVGGSKRTIVVGDGLQIGEAMLRCRGEISKLGRRYVLAESRFENLFHPKLIARLSPEGGKVFVGSGNLNFTGWGGNHELATDWQIGPEAEDDGLWLSDFMLGLEKLSASASLRQHFSETRSAIPWLSAPPKSKADRPVLIGLPGAPLLAQQLEAKLAGRKFTSVKLCTGSTDIDGAFLKWAHERLGVEEATICLTPSFASFDATKLAKLPMTVRLVKPEDDRLMHAKFYWFSGPDGNAAVMGSANCSAAAWLVGSNIELVVVYDAPDPREFSAVLQVFKGKKYAPEKLLKPALQPPLLPINDKKGIKFHLVSLQLLPDRTIEGILNLELPDKAKIELFIDSDDDNEVRFSVRGGGAKFTGVLPTDFRSKVATPFARVEITVGASTYLTPPRWIDDVAAISRVVQSRFGEVDFNQLNKYDLTDSQNFLATAHAIATSLLSFETSRMNTEPSQSSTCAPTRRPALSDNETDGKINAEEMFISIAELRSAHLLDLAPHWGSSGSSMQGLIKLFFSSEVEDEPPPERELKFGESGEEERESGTDDGGDPPEAAAPSSSLSFLGLNLAAGFKSQIDQFVDGLSSPNFAANCSAEKLINALAFPVLLALKGQQQGVLPIDYLGEVATNVVQRMLVLRESNDQPRGLLRAVQKRYADADRTQEFNTVVGRGELWTVLLACLARIDVPKLDLVIKQASAIKLVLECDEMIGACQPSQILMMARSLVIPGAEKSVTARARVIQQRLQELEKKMQDAWDAIDIERRARGSLEKPGSVLWLPKVGWDVVAKGKYAEVRVAGALNLESFARINRAISEAKDALCVAISRD